MVSSPLCIIYYLVLTYIVVNTLHKGTRLSCGMAGILIGCVCCCDFLRSPTSNGPSIFADFQANTMAAVSGKGERRRRRKRGEMGVGTEANREQRGSELERREELRIAVTHGNHEEVKKILDEGTTCVG